MYSHKKYGYTYLDALCRVADLAWIMVVGGGRGNARHDSGGVHNVLMSVV